MSQITDAHFGGNVILTRDSFLEGQPFHQILKEISFSNFRYPGGGVTEARTWENGGLDKMFGEPMEPGSEGYVLTIREALAFAGENQIGLTIVVPTFQFYDTDTSAFDEQGFDRYLDALEDALREYPDVVINDFEIGNEYWGSIEWGGLEPSDYGAIANSEIPMISDMLDRIEDDMPWAGDVRPGIGIQAGVQWKAEQGEDGRWTAVGPEHSHDIASTIDLANREQVTTIFQHSYPDWSEAQQKMLWAIRPMEVFQDLPGFADDLHFSISEFNVGEGSANGVEQGAAWIEMFHGFANMGVDEFHSWGIGYKWLSNKFYDLQFPPAESDGGEILAIATPMGQVFDIAQNHLVGKTTITDEEALRDIGAPAGLNVTGFEETGQRIVFLHNPGDGPAGISLGGLPDGHHVTTHRLIDADSPHTPWYNEATHTPSGPGGIVDARGDMKVQSGSAVEDDFDLAPGEMVVIVVSEPGRDLLIEGAHNVTDPRTGMVDDHIIGGSGNDIIRGHVGDDTLEGGDGRNVISGGRGDDTIIAAGNGDALFGGRGQDAIHGGAGNDLIVIGGQRPGDSATIELGGGKDLVLLGRDQNVAIDNFSMLDRIGFDGAFADAEALGGAMSLQDDDLVITLPGGGSVLIRDGAAHADVFPDQVFDFYGQEERDEIMEGYLDGLTVDQLEEIDRLKGDVDGLDDVTDEGPSYWSSIDDILARIRDDEEAENDEGGEDAGGEDGEPGDPDIPVAPEKPTDGGGDDEEDDGDKVDGTCFVATAAYGSPSHPDVVALRAFRDNVLAKTAAGRAFISVYWRVGPKLARITRPEQRHAAAARWLLTRFVGWLRHRGLTSGGGARGGF